MSLPFDYNVQGVYKILSLILGGKGALLLVFHTVEDGAEGGTHWVLARRDPGERWRAVKQDGVIPRLHPRDRATITREEPIDQMDAESILFLFECEEKFAE